MKHSILIIKAQLFRNASAPLFNLSMKFIIISQNKSGWKVAINLAPAFLRIFGFLPNILNINLN